jgi:orotidine-5'-phosphate decarboxylase
VSELIVALDETSLDEAVGVVNKTASVVRWYKVGYQAYYSYGEQLLPKLRERGASIFLDLKLHDIPNTVAAAVRSLARYRPAMLTVHAAGGASMMLAAAQARDEINAAGCALRLLAVTVLTSLSKEELQADREERALHELVAVRAETALRCDIDGVVCSVDEVAIVRARTGDALQVVCPGIRPAGAPADDQRRVATPAEAAMAGADYIVVGRPITKAADPSAAASAIAAELAAVKPLGSAPA